MAHTTEQGDTNRKPSIAKATGQTETDRSAAGARRMRGAAPVNGGRGGQAKTPSQKERGDEPAATAPVEPEAPARVPEQAFRSKAFRDLLQRDPLVARAVAELLSSGDLTGARSRKVSARVDPGLMAAAKRRFGLASEADVINASLAVVAAPDRFKQWWRSPQHTLTDDFELAI